MAAQVLKGEDVSTMQVEEIKESTPVYNKTVCEALGLTLPEAYQNAEDVSAS